MKISALLFNLNVLSQRSSATIPTFQKSKPVNPEMFDDKYYVQVKQVGLPACVVGGMTSREHMAIP